LLGDSIVTGGWAIARASAQRHYARACFAPVAMARLAKSSSGVQNREELRMRHAKIN